jgi:hypothetical protein
VTDLKDQIADYLNTANKSREDYVNDQDHIIELRQYLRSACDALEDAGARIAVLEDALRDIDSGIYIDNAIIAREALKGDAK